MQGRRVFVIFGVVAFCLLLLPARSGSPSHGTVAATSLTPFPTGDPRSVKVVGHIGAFPGAVLAQGNRVYLGLNEEFSVLDVSDLTHPHRLGYILLPGPVIAVKVVDHYACIANAAGGLRIVDIANPNLPVEVGSYKTGWEIGDVDVRGDFAYVAARYDGLRVVDISDPSAPVEAGSASSFEEARKLVVSGNYAYVAGGAGLWVIDVSDPHAPTMVSSLDTPGYQSTDIAMSGNYVYLTDWEKGLHVIDVSNPLKPARISTFQTPGIAWHVVIDGQRAFVTNDSPAGNGLQILDISSPVSPTLVGSYNLQNPNLTVAGNTLYLTHNEFLHVLDVTDPRSPREISKYAALGILVDVAASGTNVYPVDIYYGLHLIDASNARLPVETGAYRLYKGVTAKVLGNLAYLIGDGPDGDGLHIIDISDVFSPILVSTYATFGYDLAVSGNYAYIAGLANGLRIIDVSHPAAPREVGSLGGIYASRVAVTGQLALVTSGSEGLQLVDIANPASPAYIGVYHAPGYVLQVAATGHYAYVTWQDFSGGNYMGITAIDVADASSPTELGQYRFLAEPQDVAVDAMRAYVVSKDGTLRVIDISNPERLAEIGFYQIDAYPERVAVAGDRIYVATMNNGLFILRFQRNSQFLPLLFKS